MPKPLLRKSIQKVTLEMDLGWGQVPQSKKLHWKWTLDGGKSLDPKPNMLIGSICGAQVSQAARALLFLNDPGKGLRDDLPLPTLPHRYPSEFDGAVR